MYSAITVTKTSFTANSAGEFRGVRQEIGSGGAIGIAYLTSLIIQDDVSFLGNKADWSGGAICSGSVVADQLLVLIMGKVEIRGNHAGWRGGGVIAHFSRMEIRGEVVVMQNQVSVRQSFVRRA
eukprot:839226-Rhodomonas_salina.1